MPGKKNSGQIIKWGPENNPIVPDNPIIPYIQGDGIGPDIWDAAQPVFDRAVDTAYKGKRRITWHELLAGEKAQKTHGQENPLPETTLKDIRQYGIAIKGPLTTPVGSGFRSLNVGLRQKLDLYACVRPISHLTGTPSPVTRPERLNIVIFRENIEDVYAGVEWKAESRDAVEILEYINRKLKNSGNSLISTKSAVGIKPMSEFNTRRLVGRAIKYALENGFPTVTLVHKGNIMKYTEGAFRDWGYKVAKEEFPENVLREKDISKKFDGQIPSGHVVIKDRIADAMFQQLLLRPEEYDVIATPNLNGDYLSDAAAAQIGGLGMAPGGNIGDRCAMFEATHGTAPKYAGLDKVNPGSLILSGVQMLRFMQWKEAADLIVKSMINTVSQGIVTYDLARQIHGAQEVKCSEFGTAIVNNIKIL